MHDQQMTSGVSSKALAQYEIPGRVAIVQDCSGLAKINIATCWSTAEIYLQGAHVSQFQKLGEPPLLFLSGQSRYATGQAIRGGIPVIFPWFGRRPGLPAHGIARTAPWNLVETKALPDGGVALRFQLPDCALQTDGSRFNADYDVLITDKLTTTLSIANTATAEPLILENCLHTYFAVCDVRQIAVQGLKDCHYLDEIDDFKDKLEKNEHICILGETDRVYMNHQGSVTILDPGFKRKIIINKEGSASTVLWNPWIQKSRQMADFGDQEYLQMICVESGNIKPNSLSLPAGQTICMRLELSSEPL